MKLSLLIPLGRFPSLANACLKNIRETAPYLDIIFLANKGSTLKIDCRTEIAPFDSGPDHTQLLDWAVKEVCTSDWVIVQHHDLFWRENDWLDKITQAIEPNLAFLGVWCPSKYRYLDQNINVAGDFFGVYNRKTLLDQNLTFRSGTLGKDVVVSEKVMEAVKTEKITSITKIVIGQEYMDGSQALSWELAVHCPEKIKLLSLDFVHLIAFHRIANSIKREGRNISCPLPSNLHETMWLDAFAHYSYLSSYCFDQEEITVLPWKLFKQMIYHYKLDVNRHQKTGEWLKKYFPAAKNPLDDCITRINLNEQKYQNYLFL